MSIFEKFSEACSRVLKGQNASAPELKAMTLEEFATYAADQIEKATEEKENPAKAVPRLKALQLSIAVARSAFEGAEVEKFDVPVYSAKSELENDVMSRLDAMDGKLNALADGIDKGGEDDEAAKKKAAEEKAAAEKKAEEEKAAAEKAEAEKAGKKPAFLTDKEKEEKAAADKKAEEEKAAAAKKSADGGDADLGDEDHDLWPMDLARSVNKSEGDEIYDWGKDPVDAADAQ